jgi:hypothetical protein
MPLESASENKQHDSSKHSKDTGPSAEEKEKKNGRDSVPFWELKPMVLRSWLHPSDFDTIFQSYSFSSSTPATPGAKSLPTPSKTTPDPIYQPPKSVPESTSSIQTTAATDHSMQLPSTHHISMRMSSSTTTTPRKSMGSTSTNFPTSTNFQTAAMVELPSAHPVLMKTNNATPLKSAAQEARSTSSQTAARRSPSAHHVWMKSNTATSQKSVSRETRSTTS